MRKIFRILVLPACAFPFGAIAQQPPPKFVPFTVTEEDLRTLDARIGDLPIKMAPAVQLYGQWIASLEQRALAEAKAAEDAKKTVTSPTP